MGVLASLNVAKQRIEKADRAELVDIYEEYRRLSDEYLRRLIVDHQRIDILATVVLGYTVKPFHLRMMQYQFQHRETLQLTFRGAGKSTLCTVTKAIHYLCSDRDLRICIASKTKGNAEAFLKEIKEHLEGNSTLIRIFGSFFDPAKVSKWDNTEIEVLGRTMRHREGSITCVGVDSTIVSKHYDVILSDDLVDEDTARTKHMREKLHTWNYQTLDPCLMPPEKQRRYVGERHNLGTRYHWDDQYGRWIVNELKDHHQIIPALDEEGRSPWPELYPPSWFHAKRKKAGLVIFNAQYQCNTEAMKGEVFEYDDCIELPSEEWPDERELKVFMGVDLAISGKDKQHNDQFAIVVIGCKGRVKTGRDPDAVYVLDFYAAHLKFPAQKPKILEMYHKWDPIEAAIEANAYQAAQYQDIKNDEPDVRVVPVITDTDKITRAWKLAPLFESKKVFFRQGLAGAMIDQFVLFPNYDLKDLVDGFDLAVRAAKKRRRRKGRDNEPGVL